MASEDPARRALRPALFALLVLAVLKLIGALFGLRLLAGAPDIPSPAIARAIAVHRLGIAASLLVAYGAQFVLRLALRNGLRAGRRWARTAGYLYAAFQILGVLAIRWLGVVALLNAALGALVAAGIWRAGRATALQPPGDAAGDLGLPAA